MRLTAMEPKLRVVEGRLINSDSRTSDVDIIVNSLAGLQAAANITSEEMYICPLRNRETNTEVYCQKTLAELNGYILSLQ
ncbi:hypothetical protein V8C42DRAFT_325961 [Trichoderma barbatum]